ncbi:3-hydroxy-3-methylglutaryl coenzyme A reductase [Philodulcilactobacillus myokoensis]|uniref:3-hydroxy-3-methylglutaryl coenzyme A reductase n=1 Tax=Philodulcilactobacillus myokoensis TaxID=2929573 RepID=A0A9W6B1J4_9LACO|nr:hydroxymethylglutaryl-CoA reductase, degradative [Philodulcilactobacillus myokoensis]GLB47237.1 3-hydroxy-3-methylglutaryl coenzyme A reductase [Philodulcilactobacillus myokoensis]
MQNKLHRFYRHDYQKRLSMIQKIANLSEDEIQGILKHKQQRGNDLIENYLTDYSIPEGIGVNLTVNGKTHLVPMVTEEPSVIAAASNGSEMLSDHNGINAKVLGRQLIGQIVIQYKSKRDLSLFIEQHRDELLEIADDAHPTIKKYGGGAKKIRVRFLNASKASIDLFVDVGEAMGANIMNSMLEAVANFIETQLGQIVIMSILSNYAIGDLTRVVGKVNFDQLATKKMTGELVADKIVIASQIAQIDPFRAATHNKGIMNGIDALVMATGNDWRAVEASIHAYAARDGQYKGLSQWHLDGNQLVGTMTLPLALGFVGGATKVLPMARINQKIAGIKSARELMRLVAALGLAQNLAALKAIVSDGIQRGHMRLQMKSLALSAGAKSDEVGKVSNRLRHLKHPNVSDAKKIIKTIRENQV